MSYRVLPAIQHFFSFLFLCAVLASSVVISASESKYESIDWIDLLPEKDLEALRNPPGYLDDIEDGSPEDTLDTLNRDPAENNVPYGSEFADLNDDFFDSGSDFSSNADFAYKQALVSTKIVEKLDGKAVRIPGFVVPIEFDDDLTITRFFLVPYFGACIHLPPPPPNQMVLVDYPKGISMENLYTPLWVSGELGAEVTRNSLGTSAYSMQMDVFEMYEE